MKCMFVPLKYSDCIHCDAPPSIHYGADRYNHQIAYRASRNFQDMCLHHPPEVLMSKAIFRSAVNALHSYDLLLCFGLSTHSTTHGYLLYVVIHTYNHVPGTYTCTNETTTCIDYS